MQTPPGIGGRGELAFIDSVYCETHFILYHGITTFLRLGDISFIERESWRVTHIGELKTVQESLTQGAIKLHLIGEPDGTPPKLLRKSDITVPSSSKFEQRTTATVVLTQRMLLRLKRQAQHIGKAFSECDAKARLAIHDSYHIEELKKSTGRSG